MFTGLQPSAYRLCRHVRQSGEGPSAGGEEGRNSAPANVESVGYGTLAQLGRNLDLISDTNQLQTALTAAIAAEDYGLAARIRDRITQVVGGAVSHMDWSTLGLPAWLVDRLERLNFKFPTDVQRRAAPVIMAGCDAAVQSATGSGKTLSFLAPTLARLDYPPQLYLDDLKGPQAIIVVPTMELGVQCALLTYKLFGGNISQGRPGDVANMFTYFGPKGIRVRGVLNKEEVVMAKETSYLSQVHLVVATPQALMEVCSAPDAKPVLDHLKVLVVDEFDECFKQSPELLAVLLSLAANNNASGTKPQFVLVGATIEPSHVEVAVSAGWLEEPVQVLVGKQGTLPSSLQHRYLVCDQERHLAALVRMLRQDLQQRGQDMTPARAMVFVNSAEEAAAAAEPLRSALWAEHRMAVLLPPGSPPLAPPPGMRPAADEAGDGPNSRTWAVEDNTASTSKELAGSSPFSATDPVRALLSFRDSKTSLLLCTSQAARGLDLPAVSHVYNVGLPSDSTQYLHRAGRAGRIGSTTGGVVTTIVTSEQLPQLLEMASRLCIEMSEEQDDARQPPSDDYDVEVKRRNLEDLFNLM